MAIEAVAAIAAKEVAVEAAKEAALQSAREIAQKMATEAGAQGSGSELQTAMMERQTMQEGFRVGEMPENKGEGREILKQREADAAEELRGKLDNEELRPEAAEDPETHAVSSTEREVHWPQTGGHWEGDETNGWRWIPDGDVIPPKNNEGGHNWAEILGREKIDGIPFSKDGEPDFSEISRGDVQIENFSTVRNDNFTQADIKLSEQWNQDAKDGKSDWTPNDVRAYRTENKLVWHEHSDMKTMDLKPKDVHNNIPHSGGISVAKHLPESPSLPKQSLLA